MSKEILKVSNLKKYFKTPKGMLHAVDDINFSLDEGKTLGVVGESGCGKSTLGRTILRLLEPTSGSVFFENSDIAKLNAGEMRKLRQKMQIIFQDPFASLNPRRTVASLIGNPMKIHKTYKSKKEFEGVRKKLFMNL